MKDAGKKAPEVRFGFKDEPKPGELEELIANRDALLQQMGYLPPDDVHEFWWKPESDNNGPDTAPT